MANDLLTRDQIIVENLAGGVALVRTLTPPATLDAIDGEVETFRRQMIESGTEPTADVLTAFAVGCLRGMRNP